MRLGMIELRRSPGRFAVVAGAVGFIVFLALILAALSDGLYLGQTGAYRSSEADMFVFSEDAGFELSGSTIEPSLARDVASSAGVGAVGRLSSFNTTATSAGNDLQLTLVGADDVTMPSVIVAGRRPEAGASEVLVDEQTRRQGLEVGSVISVHDGPELQVVGVSADAGFGLTTAWAAHDLFTQVRSSVRPELADLSGTAQALGVVTDGSGAAASVADLEGVEPATPEEAIGALPAATQQKSTLDGIVLTTFAVAAIVVGLFFALITLEKRHEYALLKAVGISNKTLIGAIFVQALVASMVGFSIGFGLSRLAGILIPAEIPAIFLQLTAVTLFLITLLMGALGAVFSFRRVLKIDPANALGGAA